MREAADYLSTKLYGVTFQKTIILMYVAVRNSELKLCILSYYKFSV